ncbi:VOC family protein [Pedobacter frigoris]|uniref:Glyoxalase n=1 Tax=Pedobacter frigoris TaxID=2571272 RepID=A0A4V6WN23_9SPHI|nr:VOC family protein [Pedobacter frigoris]TKC04280.1 glyoxalase [Pedobacter frigoris]
MKVLRIVPNFQTDNLEAAKCFYQQILGLDILMDHGWIVTYGSLEPMQVQVSFAANGGSGTAVPDLSIEVDKLDVAYEKMREAGFEIEYGPVNEPWGVRRFYVRDPFNKLINILAHLEKMPGES